MPEQNKPNTQSQDESAAPAGQSEAKPTVDYSRYMGTLNRIYRRGNSPNAKRLQDMADARNGVQPQSAENGKKDYSFWITLAVILAAALVIWLVKNYLL